MGEGREEERRHLSFLPTFPHLVGKKKEGKFILGPTGKKKRGRKKDSSFLPIFLLNAEKRKGRVKGEEEKGRMVFISSPFLFKGVGRGEKGPSPSHTCCCGEGGIKKRKKDFLFSLLFVESKTRRKGKGGGFSKPL